MCSSPCDPPIAAPGVSCSHLAQVSNVDPLQRAMCFAPRLHLTRLPDTLEYAVCRPLPRLILACLPLDTLCDRTDALEKNDTGWLSRCRRRGCRQGAQQGCGGRPAQGRGKVCAACTFQTCPAPSLCAVRPCSVSCAARALSMAGVHVIACASSAAQCGLTVAWVNTRARLRAVHAQTWQEMEEDPGR